MRNVKCIDSDSIGNLKHCLDSTDWCAFRDICTDINEHTHMVTSYVKFCQDLCFAEKQVKCYNNSKPWFNSDIKDKMKQQEEAFRENDKAKMTIAKYNVRKAIKTAKKDYSVKLEDTFSNNDTRAVNC